MGTFLGGLLTIIMVRYVPAGASTNNLLGVLQAFSAGVMLYMTFIDLLPEAKESVGGRECMLWFFGGVVVFGVLETLILPAAEGGDHHNHAVNGDSHHVEHVETTTIKTPETTRKRRSNATAASPTPTRARKPAAPVANERQATERKQLLRTSLVTFVAMGLHNLPEGLSVYLGALADPRLGLQLAAAICLHNIPEGMAVAIPLWAATKSNYHVLYMTLINGLMEPLGVLLGGFFLKNYLTQSLLSKSLAAVAGIMACISIHELFPTAVTYAGKERASFALFLGMAVCFVALEGVDVIMS
ncbi:hypothetical protein SmJEL517_g01924 [Synchytrium microbalum]|uniref:Zinc/iron permease n=1 Tax=Synchytrium microbalum TaxID=1806994 RepID=A0A507CDN6_9FUNG|nr:uncharacterized protein SmJEL517_g01924 [Synchytrium microbalum]TPX35675.1 hypothetical protein SmJEL517_g01924 [Synchytrium microbalum]